MNTRGRPVATFLRLVTTLALSLLCSLVEAKQPTPAETGPQIYPARVYFVNHQRRMRLPLVEVWKDKGSHLEFVEYALPGGWQYMYDETGFRESKFWRSNWNGEGSEELTISDVEIIGGLPW